jgi:hypothetical protein
VSPGAVVSLIGLDFRTSTPVQFTLDDTVVATVMSNEDGFVSAEFTLPAGSHGEHTIKGTDGANWDDMTFSIEEDPPSIPQPRAPGMNANVKSPVKFDWDAAVDVSNPITYNLQISTDANFTAGTIIIDKVALTDTEYTLTKEELLKLSDGKANYYWREKSVDAALNESSWSPAIAFTVTQPFKFTGWPMYLTFGVAGVALFLLGLWLGRRTAFFY